MENVVDNDDFGDLYTDVEVQASSAISAVIQSSTLKPLTGVEHSAVEKCNGETEVRKEECESESESEDDLNIVLNDSEDYNDFLNEDEAEENAEGSGSGHNSNGSENRNGDKSDCKYTRPPRAAYSSHLKANESSCVYSYPTPLVNSNWDENGCIRMDSSSAAQNGLNFSLPRSRNILDVNIDMFEKKPWRNPGADLTDYFNFGFNEDSWKHYCSCLDRHREQAKREAKDSYYKTLKNNTPNGRVIEVEESTIERQPSMNLGRSQDRDSGVVIQITLQDSEEDPVNFPKEQGKASESGDAGEDRRDQFFSSASEDELPSLEGTGGGSGNSTSRRNTPVRECVSMDSDNYVNSEFSDRTLGEIESSHDAKKSSDRDISNPGTSVMSCKALYGEGQDHIQCSSLSRSHGVASRDHPKRLRNTKSELREKGRIDYPHRTSGGSDYFTQGRRFRKRDEDFRRSGPMIRYERCNSSMVQHRKRDGRHAFDSREREVTSHFKEVKPYRSNARSLSDYPLRVTYTKHDNPLELSAATDGALSEDRSHFVAIDESGYLIDDYIPYLDYEEIDRMRNNKRKRTDDLVTECKYIYDITKETDSRYRPYSDRDTSSLEDYYHLNLTYFRRETKSPRRGGRGDKSPRNSLNGECCMGLNNEEGRFDRWQNPTLSCGRHRIFCGSPISADKRIKYPVDRDNFERGGGYPLSEQLQWVEDENDYLYRQNILDAERTSSVFRRISRDRSFESFDKKHRSNLLGTLLEDRNMNHERYIVMREGNNSGEIGQGSKFFHRVNHRRRFSRWKDSAVPSTVVENRESGWRSCNLDSDSYVEPKPTEGIRNHHVRKTLRTRNLKANPNDNGKGRLDIFSNAQQEESLDIEEGQITPEELNEKIVKRRKTSFSKSQISEMKSSANDNMVTEGQDNARILEIMAKMEKRRERFKEPIAPKTGPQNVSKPSIDLFAGTTEAIQPRPARKRKWV